MFKKIGTGLIIASSAIYAYFLINLLFLGPGREMVLLSENMQVHYHYNLIPFKTIFAYIQALIEGSIRGHALRNLAGNLLLFFPLGFYLPFYTQRMLKLKVYAIFVTAVIVLVEVIQLISLTGSLDIDDFILNFIGALAGLWICKHTPIRNLMHRIGIGR